jgi:hypothetical protein
MLVQDHRQAAQLQDGLGAASIVGRARVQVREGRRITGEGEVRAEEQRIKGLRDDEVEGDDAVADYDEAMDEG